MGRSSRGRKERTRAKAATAPPSIPAVKDETPRVRERALLQVRERERPPARPSSRLLSINASSGIRFGAITETGSKYPSYIGDSVVNVDHWEIHDGPGPEIDHSSVRIEDYDIS